jgi:tetratricopeptide (TPR) repeat protein
VRSGAGARRAWAHVAVLAGVCLTLACAAHQPRSLADRFVRHASKKDLQSPAVDLGGPPVAISPDAMPAETVRAAAQPGTVIETADEALARALAALEQSPSTTEPYRLVGAEYRRLGIYDHAIAQLDKALAIDRRAAAVYEERARVWRDMGWPGAGLGDATRAVYFAPASPSAHNTLGTVRYALGDEDGAREAFERVLALDPTAAYAHSNLCYLAHLAGDGETARAHCDSAIALQPGLAVAKNNLGLVYAAAGWMPEAQRAFIAAAGDAGGLYNIGITHLARHEYDKAAEAFDAALRLQPALTAASRRAAEARRLAAEHRGTRPPAAAPAGRTRRR